MVSRLGPARLTIPRRHVRRITASRGRHLWRSVRTFPPQPPGYLPRHSSNHPAIALHRRLLLWDCPAECDYLCQHATTARRIQTGRAIVQFHGKWPFRRILGMQEPFSVLFSLANLWAHATGLAHLRASVPPSYPLLRFYKFFAYVGIASWVFSSIFHTRDFAITEELDYLAAGASVLCGLYYTAVRVFRLDRPDSRTRRRLRAWTTLCAVLFAAHVGYLKGVRWSYTYNMSANVVVGVLHNILWYWLSVQNYLRTGHKWTLVPIVVVTWIMLAGCLELFDFPPIWGFFDAHCLWHLGTVAPVYILYR